MSRSLLAGLALLVLTGCGASDVTQRRLDVHAASSLTDVFRELEELFEIAHPDTDVVLTYAGSQLLRIQIEEGAPADVFASANHEHVQALLEAGLVSGPRIFATNRLVVVVPLDNPAGVETFADLPQATRLVLGTPGVPAGRYARDVLLAADSVTRPGFSAAVLENLVSEAPNVRLARAKVELGEADAAIVYRTDALRSDRVQIVPLPTAVSVGVEYTAAIVERSDRSRLAGQWLDYLWSDEARAVFTRHGFGDRDGFDG